MTKQEHFIDNTNAKIHCIEFNRQENNIPLIIIPGATNSAEEIEEALYGKLLHHHIIVSLRGRGKSDSPKSGYTLDDHASDVLAVMRELNINNCYLFGYSIGSTVGVRVAATIQDKVKGLIMGDYAPYFPPFNENWAVMVRKHADRAISEIAIDGLVNEGEYTEAAGDFEQITCPVMLVKGGKEGSLFPSEAIPYMQKLVPDLRLEILEENDHDIFSPRPDRLAAVIEDFLKN
ncbi:MAG: alpha/beta hydrolase [Chitinophagales bacterium]